MGYYMELIFEWDPIKARTNVEKHGISFEMAAQVFKGQSI